MLAGVGDEIHVERADGLLEDAHIASRKSDTVRISVSRARRSRRTGPPS